LSIPRNFVLMRASPVASGRSSDSVVCCFEASYATDARRVVGPCVTDASAISRSSAFNTTVCVGRAARTRISSSPVNVAAARSGVKVSV
jgi:hypothetical protein